MAKTEGGGGKFVVHIGIEVGIIVKAEAVCSHIDAKRLHESWTCKRQGKVH